MKVILIKKPFTNSTLFSFRVKSKLSNCRLIQAFKVILNVFALKFHDKQIFHENFHDFTNSILIRFWHLKIKFLLNISVRKINQSRTRRIREELKYTKIDVYYFANVNEDLPEFRKSLAISN